MGRAARAATILSLRPTRIASSAAVSPLALRIDLSAPALTSNCTARRASSSPAMFCLFALPGQRVLRNQRFQRELPPVGLTLADLLDLSEAPREWAASGHSYMQQLFLVLHDKSVRPAGNPDDAHTLSWHTSQHQQLPQSMFANSRSFHQGHSTPCAQNHLADNRSLFCFYQTRKNDELQADPNRE